MPNYQHSCTGKWDDADRVLYLIRCLNPHERAKLSHSVWKNARVPFDRVYADEVQDLTQAELTLFVLCCKNFVDGLFLAGDNAQAITGGVSFRFEELRSIIKRADPKKDRVKTMDLLHNYRSHSGIIDLASQVLELLEMFFTGSYSKLEFDTGLCRGARPGVWSPPNGFESIRNALRFEQKFIIITRDDNKFALREKLQHEAGDDPDRPLRSLPVLGIVDSKGLEFYDVMIVDFFTSASKPLQDGWRKILDKKNFPEEIRRRRGGGKDGTILLADKNISGRLSGSVSKELEVDIKALYTAITRCRDRLVICESNTENNILWQKFKRFIVDETKLGTVQNFAESKEDGAKINAMMSDDCINLAIDFIEVAEECDDPEQKKENYNNARNFVLQAQRADILKRLDCCMKHVDLWDTLRRSNGSISHSMAAETQGSMAESVERNDEVPVWAKREELAVQASIDFLNEGMARDALKLCNLANSRDSSVVEPLMKRINNILGDWRQIANENPEIEISGTRDSPKGGGK